MDAANDLRPDYQQIMDSEIIGTRIIPENEQDLCVSSTNAVMLSSNSTALNSDCVVVETKNSEIISAANVGTVVKEQLHPAVQPETSFDTDSIADDWERFRSNLAESQTPDSGNDFCQLGKGQSVAEVKRTELVTDDCVKDNKIDLDPHVKSQDDKQLGPVGNILEGGHESCCNDVVNSLSVDDVLLMASGEESVNEPSTSSISSTVTKKSKLSKDVKQAKKEAIISPDLNINSRPKRSTPRRSVFEMLQGEIRPSTTMKKRRDSETSDVVQMFSGSCSSDEDKPRRKHKPSSSARGCAGGSKAATYDFTDEPVYSADDFGEIDMSALLEPTSDNANIKRMSKDNGSCDKAGDINDGLWTNDTKSKVLRNAAADKSHSSNGATEGNDLETSYASSSTTVPWLAAQVSERAAAAAAAAEANDEAASTGRSPPEIYTSLKAKPKDSRIISANSSSGKKFNIDRQTGKCIRIRDSPVGRGGGRMSVGGGGSKHERKMDDILYEGSDPDREKLLKSMAAKLKVKEGKLKSLDQELDQRAASIKLLEGRVLRREQALKDTEKSIEYRLLCLRRGEATQAKLAKKISPDKDGETIDQNQKGEEGDDNVMNQCSLGGIHVLDVTTLAKKQEELERLHQQTIEQRQKMLSNEQRLARWESELRVREQELEMKGTVMKNRDDGSSRIDRGSVHNKPGRPTGSRTVLEQGEVVPTSSTGQQPIKHLKRKHVDGLKSAAAVQAKKLLTQRALAKRQAIVGSMTRKAIGNTRDFKLQKLH